jgi:hypothetical protein
MRLHAALAMKFGAVSTVERAYQLAAGGECASVSQIQKKLRLEGFVDVAAQFSSRMLTNDLRRRIEAARQGA